MININDYKEIVGKDTITELFSLAEKLKGKTIQNINSTSVGGGVAEILSKMVPLLKQLGLNADWNVIRGDGKFFEITKKIHNALHGRKENVTKEDFEYFIEINRNNISTLDLSSDIMFIHYPQPIGLIEKRKDYQNNWIWRCHIDITSAQKDIYDFFKTYILQYDSCVFSAPSFSKKDLNLPQILISPSIDPLSDKNKELSEQEIIKIFEKYGLDLSRPIVTQISRFDYLKDPIGVLKAFKLAKRYNDCQLILAGGGATDDPEGIKVYEEVIKEANGESDIHILLLPQDDLTINALVRGSTIILQKSIKEGFGLTVSEALWKEKPVIASAVGGIPLQITHKYSGILTYSIEGTAYYLKQLLNDPEYAKQLAKNGKEHVKSNFLITRHLKEYLLLFLSMYYKEDVIYF